MRVQILQPIVKPPSRRWHAIGVWGSAGGAVLLLGGATPKLQDSALHYTLQPPPSDGSRLQVRRHRAQPFIAAVSATQQKVPRNHSASRRRPPQARRSRTRSRRPPGSP